MIWRDWLVASDGGTILFGNEGRGRHVPVEAIYETASFIIDGTMISKDAIEPLGNDYKERYQDDVLGVRQLVLEELIEEYPLDTSPAALGLGMYLGIPSTYETGEVLPELVNKIVTDWKNSTVAPVRVNGIVHGWEKRSKTVSELANDFDYVLGSVVSNRLLISLANYVAEGKGSEESLDLAVALAKDLDYEVSMNLDMELDIFDSD